MVGNHVTIPLSREGPVKEEENKLDGEDAKCDPCVASFL